MIKDRGIFRQELEKANRFWLTERVEEKEDYPEERDDIEDICRDAELKKISIITGPRRVGKSVLIKHIIARLIAQGAKPRNILYYSLEDPYLKIYCDNLIKDTFDYWLENIAEDGRKYVFFDEVHFVDEWYKWLKVIYDGHKEIKIFISGSSSLTLQKEANRYLRGRYILHEVWPLTFRQFLKLKGTKIGELKPDALFIDKMLEIHKGDFRQYMLAGGFPEFLEVKDSQNWFKILKSSISNKAIYEDIATMFRIRNTKILEQIFVFIVANQSRILSYEKINEAARLKHEILTNYIEYLKSSYLIIEILKLAKTVKEQLKSKKKFLCVDQGLRNSMLRDYEVKEDNEGFIIENMVGVHSFINCLRNDRKMTYLRSNGEIDFVLKNRETLVIEVKYKDRITKKDMKKVKDGMRGVGCTRGFIITKSDFRIVREGNISIMLVPAPVFCMFTDEILE